MNDTFDLLNMEENEAEVNTFKIETAEQANSSQFANKEILK